MPRAISCTGWGVSMLLKISGGLCVVAGASGLGFWLADQWRIHLKYLEQLRKMIFLLKGEILYAHSPLEEAFFRAGKKSGGELGVFFVDISRRIENQSGELFFTIWQEEIAGLGKRVPLSEKDRSELLGFGEHLGYLDLEMQERTILLYLEQLDLEIDYLREHQREKCRLYTSLGVMGGLFLAIIMS